MCFYQGYYGNGVNAIIVFAACFLPDSDREDYHEIMENLFLWVLHWLTRTFKHLLFHMLHTGPFFIIFYNYESSIQVRINQDHP